MTRTRQCLAECSALCMTFCWPTGRPWSATLSCSLHRCLCVRHGKRRGAAELHSSALVHLSIKAPASPCPPDMLLGGPRVLRDLMTLVQAGEAQRVLVHIYNLENLSEAAASNAGTTMRDLRDPLFMHNGLHVVVVGTPDAIQAAVMAHPQVRTTFSVRTLEPLPRAEAGDGVRGSRPPCAARLRLGTSQAGACARRVRVDGAEPAHFF